jgi:hypothetical protein
MAVVTPLGMLALMVERVFDEGPMAVGVMALPAFAFSDLENQVVLAPWHKTAPISSMQVVGAHVPHCPEWFVRNCGATALLFL